MIKLSWLKSKGLLPPAPILMRLGYYNLKLILLLKFSALL